MNNSIYNSVINTCPMCKGKKKIFCATENIREILCPICQGQIFEIQSMNKEKIVESDSIDPL